MALCSSQPPCMNFKCGLWRCARALMPHSHRPPLASVLIMVRFILFDICFRLLSTRLLLAENRPQSLPVPLLSTLFTRPFISTVHSMTRPRGRPKQGSPWQPHSSAGCSPTKFDSSHHSFNLPLASNLSVLPSCPSSEVPTPDTLP